MPKQVYISSKDISLNYCCGINEVGGWSFGEQDAGESCYKRPKLQDLLPSGTGLFVSTFTKAPTCQAALKALLKKHTVVFNTDYLPTTSSYATPVGREKGIALYVFKFGKEEVNASI